VGIPPDFDLRKYQETLREQYGNLKLESLDTTGYAYNDLKLWRMFIPQDVRPCQEFNPKVYELPKDKLRELVDRGELDAAALDLEAANWKPTTAAIESSPSKTCWRWLGARQGWGSGAVRWRTMPWCWGIRGRGNRPCCSMWPCSGPSSPSATCGRGGATAAAVD
jgi:hypothetical protein